MNFKKFLKGTALNGLAYLGLGLISPISANNNLPYFQTEINYCTQEISFSAEAHHLQGFYEKESFSLEDYEEKIKKACSDKELSYAEIKDLYQTLKKVKIEESPVTQITQNIENKIKEYYAALAKGGKPELELTTEDLLTYIVTKNNPLIFKAEEKNLESLLAEKEKHEKAYENYLNIVENWWLKKDFVQKDSYIFAGVLPSSSRSAYFNKFHPAKKEIEELQQIKSLGAEVKTLNEDFPIKQKYPQLSPWFWINLGLVFPMLRNLLITRYVAGKNADGGRYLLSGVTGITNGLVGASLLDHLHPLVYPPRMLATPIIIQPILHHTGRKI